MSTESTAGRSTAQEAIELDWEHPTPPTDLIFDDGEPLESARHRIAMNVLIASAIAALGDRPDSFVGGNMFVYYSRNQAMNREFRSPDFFVALDVDGTRERQGWVTWEEDGCYPDVVVELLSPSTAQVDRTTKKDLYERVFRTADSYTFDPFEPSTFEGWHLTNQHYQALQPNAEGHLWCEALGLWLGTWTGSVQREPPTGTCEWLRFYDAQGNLILLPKAQERSRAEQAEAQLEQVREQLRARGIDPDEVLG